MILFKKSKPREGKAEPRGRAVRGLAARFAPAQSGVASLAVPGPSASVPPARLHWWRWW